MHIKPCVSFTQIFLMIITSSIIVAKFQRQVIGMGALLLIMQHTHLAYTIFPHMGMCVCVYEISPHIYTSNYHHNQNTELFQNHKENLLRSPLIFPLHTPVLLLPLATTNLYTISIVLSFSKCYTIIQIDFFL